MCVCVCVVVVVVIDVVSPFMLETYLLEYDMDLSHYWCLHWMSVVESMKS